MFMQDSVIIHMHTLRIILHNNLQQNLHLMKVYIYLLQQFLDVENTVKSSTFVQYKPTEISSYYIYTLILLNIATLPGPVLDLCWVQLSRPIWCPRKKYFHQKWLKMTSGQGVCKQAKCPFFENICPKKCTHAPNVQNIFQNILQPINRL